MRPPGITNIISKLDASTMLSYIFPNIEGINVGHILKNVTIQQACGGINISTITANALLCSSGACASVPFGQMVDEVFGDRAHKSHARRRTN